MLAEEELSVNQVGIASVDACVGVMTIGMVAQPQEVRPQIPVTPECVEEAIDPGPLADACESHPTYIVC